MTPCQHHCASSQKSSSNPSSLHSWASSILLKPAGGELSTGFSINRFGAGTSMRVERTCFTGPIVDQTEIFANFGDPALQDMAAAAVREFAA